MKNILIPFEFNKPSKEALRYAVSIGSKFKGTITLLYSYILAFANEALLTTKPSFDTKGGLVAASKQMIESRMARIIKDYETSKCKIDVVIIVGNEEGSLRKLIKSRHIDLIVMGSGSSETHSHWIVQQILKVCAVPVLIVKKAARLSHVKKILFPCSLEIHPRRIINQLKDIQKTFGATIHLLMVNTPDKFISEEEAHHRFKEFQKHYKLTKLETHFYSARSEGDGISRVAREMKPDLIVMPTHAREGLSRVFHGSVMERVLNDSNTPLVAMRLE